MPVIVADGHYWVEQPFQLGDSDDRTQTGPVVAGLQGGGFVAAWMGEDGYNDYGIRAQFFNEAGEEVGGEILVNSNLQGVESEPAVTVLSSGDVVITWSDESSGAGFDIHLQRFSSTGARLGSELVVNTVTANFQVQSHVSSLAGGGFVVVWESHDNGTQFSDTIHGQVFSATGAKIGSEIVVSPNNPGDTLIPDVVGLKGGGFVAAWFEYGGELDGGNLSPGCRAQLFDASGNKVGSPFAINHIVPGTQQDPALAATDDGGFVAAWADLGGYWRNDDDDHIWFQKFDASGAKLGAPVKAGSLGPNVQDSPDIEVVPGIGFMVAWRDRNATADNPTYHIRAQLFSFDGIKIGEEFVVSAPGAAGYMPDIAVLENGAIVITSMTNGNSDDVVATLLRQPTLGTDGADHLSGTQDQDFLSGQAGDDELLGNGGSDGLVGGAGNDHLLGGSGDDQLLGDTGDDLLEGADGGDRMTGGVGNDTLNGGSGADALVGGAGNDIYIIDEAGDTISEAANEGTDAVNTSLASYTLGANLEWLVYTGANSFTGTGNGLANVLTGGSGNDMLDGAGGADTMNGGAGNDSYIVDAATDVVNEAAGAGEDTVRTALAIYTLGSNLERLVYTGAAAFAGTGNEHANMIKGGAGNDALSGLAGNDVLEGGAGNDSLDGGADGDVASYATATGAVTVSLLRTDAQNTGGAGIDTLISIEGLIGSAFADSLTGGNSDDLLDGGAGADRLKGGTGNDRYVVDNIGDKVVEANGQGGDTVDASVTFTLAGQYLEALNLTGNAAINGSGNGLDNRIIGNSAANTLNGAGGNDRLDGAGGNDRMIGGLGNDTFVVDSSGDVISELADEGSDTVEASITYSIAGQYIETLKLTGTANINATGNGQANTLTGNGGNNVLNGGGGADTMAGGAGNDRYIVDNALDKVSELTGEGIDTVEASVTFTIAGQHIEELRLTGTAAIDGSGNSLANTMWGNGAANKLNGSTGDDALHGGLGSDTLTGGAGADHFWFESDLGAANIDRITDFSAADDTIDLDRSIFTGIAANGVLDASAFRLGTTALDADDRILYDKATGNLWYDPDGAGGTYGAVLFAKVTANTNLTAADFFGSP